MSNQTVVFLRSYNRWRRGDETLEQPCPRLIGQEIDSACDLIERLEREINNLIDQRDCAINLHKWSVRQVQDMADECNKMGRERDQWRECAEWLADSVRFWIGAEKEFVDTGAALAEFERLKGLAE